jgi:hypothetical protein
MAQAVKGLFGSVKKDNTAQVEAEKSRQLQAVANDRQLAEVNRNKTAVGATRRAPRGRRLFEDGGSSDSSSVLA